MKKILIIAYLFPPIGGGGVQRALKMAKYLQQYDVEVSILTVANPHHVSLDPSLLEQLPESVKIYRAKEWLLPKFNPLSDSKQMTSNDDTDRLTGKTKGKLKKSILQFIKPTLKAIKNTVLIPDDQILWYKNAVRQGIEIIKEKNIDVVFSTSGPYTNHLVAKAMKKKTNVFWIADFRDPWTQNMHRPKQKWRLHIEEKLERDVIETSDMLTTVTHSFARNFQKKYQSSIKRIEVIHNGFDPEDYINLKPVKNFPEKWTFVYTGVFYQERNPQLFLQCVAELIDEGKLDKSQLSIQFAGVFDYPGYSDNINCVKKYGLESVVYLWGNLAHKDALALLAGADQLLLIGDVSPDSSSYIPGKLFEYMAVQKPIFALSVSGETANIIEEQRIGKVIDPNDKETIKKTLLHGYEMWLRNEGQKVELSNTTLYQRDEQARMLAEIVKSIN